MPSRQVSAIAIVACAAAAIGLTACSAGQAPAEQADSTNVIVAVGAENQYANVISQIGGRYVQATAVERNPNTDPHTFEASPSVARAVGTAQLVVQNGIGYDAFMNKIEDATPDPARKVIIVQQLLGLPDSTPNPHLWYSPAAMPAVARAVAAGLTALQPAHAAYFRGRQRVFDRSLRSWYRALAQLRADFPRTPVATTEPVSNYLLQAAGTENLTPAGLQANIMNGVDPAPQDVQLQESLFSRHQVRVFVYNQQVTDSLTQSFVSMARRNGIPVVGVYETMPARYDYQSWMLAETRALRRAIAARISTEKL